MDHIFHPRFSYFATSQLYRYGGGFANILFEMRGYLYGGSSIFGAFGGALQSIKELGRLRFVGADALITGSGIGIAGAVGYLGNLLFGDKE